MWPNLISLGPIVISSLNVMVVVALLAGLFAFWRKGKEEHYDEMMLFDALLLSFVFGAIAARLVFIGLNFTQFGFNVLSWFDLISLPGFNLMALYLGSAAYIFRYARLKKWDAYEILDFWSLGAGVSLVFLWLGYWLAGINFGTATSLPWGMIFEGLFEPHHPVQLYYALFFVFISWYLAWAEFKYRTFRWYRGHKNTAQSGFLISMLMIGTGIFSLAMVFITISPTTFGVRLDALASLLLLIGGLVLLYQRSGHEWFSRKNRRHFNTLNSLKVS